MRQWDPYPFILLNLALSFQAAYAAPFIMMSQNRQQDIDRKSAEDDFGAFPNHNTCSVTGLTMKRICCLALLFAFALIPNALAQGGLKPVELPQGYWPLAKSQAVIDKTKIIRIAPDLSRLNEGERKAVAKLVEVGEIFRQINEEQRHPQALASYAALRELDRQLGSPPETKNLLTLYALNRGPIATTLSNEREPFLPVDGESPGKNVYPWKITKDEVEGFLSAHPESREAILALRTVVRRAEVSNLQKDLSKIAQYPALATLHPTLSVTLRRLLSAPDRKTLYAVPYSVAYADELMRAYFLLFEAADAVQEEDRDFAGFLRNRARDLLTNDNESGDAAWVTGQFKNLNAVIGAYEVYSDELFAAKAFFTLVLFIQRVEETNAVRLVIKNPQALEDSLPYSPRKNVRDRIPFGIFDMVIGFGDNASAGAEILPNENYLQRYGRIILLRSNVIGNPDLFLNQSRGWAAVVPAHADDLTPHGKGMLYLWHEVGHYLGVERTKDGVETAVALAEAAPVLEEMKAELVSGFLGLSLRQQGYYNDRQLRSLYANMIDAALLTEKPRREQPYQTLWLVEWNYFLEHGLLSFDRASGTLSIDYDRYQEVVTKLLETVLEIQYSGDKQAADRFIQRYSTWDEDLHGVIAKKRRDAEQFQFSHYEFEILDR